MHILRWLVLYVVIVKLTDVFDFEWGQFRIFFGLFRSLRLIRFVGGCLKLLLLAFHLLDCESSFVVWTFFLYLEIHVFLSKAFDYGGDPIENRLVLDRFVDIFPVIKRHREAWIVLRWQIELTNFALWLLQKFGKECQVEFRKEFFALIWSSSLALHRPILMLLLNRFVRDMTWVNF